MQTPGGIFAKGKDPNFEPWSDVLQLNAFSPELRHQVAQTMQDIARMCDGVRCDMAMLMMNTIFKQTWAERVGDVPMDEYWPHIIAAARKMNPDFMFLAEVYWGKQQDMLDQGFDLCYDKDLYDQLLRGSVYAIKQQLEAPLPYQKHLLRFLENHDEERVAKEFPLDKHFAAAVITATLPGARLYYDGEREGRAVKVPVHLGRRVEEPVNAAIALFYDKLWTFTAEKKFAQGEWQLLTATSKLFHRESRQIIAWKWATETTDIVIVVNYSSEKASAILNTNLAKVSRSYDILKGLIDPTEHINSSRVTLDAWQHIVIEIDK